MQTLVIPTLLLWTSLMMQARLTRCTWLLLMTMNLCFTLASARKMLVAGPLLLAAGFVTFVLWPAYPGFLLGEVLLGLGHSVLSGPPTVALYETLKAHGQQRRYLAEESRIHARRLYGTGAAFLIGGAVVRFGDATGAAYVPERQVCEPCLAGLYGEA